MFKRTALILLATLLVPQGSLWAAELPAPKGDVILIVSGEIENTNTDQGTLEMDLEMLRTMVPTVFATKTIWLPDAVEFTGVSLKAIMDFAGASGESIGATALNDYTVEIPTDSITNNAPIIAYFLDGEEMSPRGKGPLWVVYPYSADKKYRTEVIYSRSIWQLDRLEFLK